MLHIERQDGNRANASNQQNRYSNERLLYVVNSSLLLEELSPAAPEPHGSGFIRDENGLATVL